MKLIPKTVLA